jgi:hypothetical protein
VSLHPLGSAEHKTKNSYSMPVEFAPPAFFLFLCLLVKKFYGPQYQFGFLSLINVGRAVFTACVKYFSLSFTEVVWSQAFFAATV